MKIRILPLVILVVFISLTVKVSSMFFQRLNETALKLNYKYTKLAQENVLVEEGKGGKSEDEKLQGGVEDEKERKSSPGYKGKEPKEIKESVSNKIKNNSLLMNNLSKRRKELEKWQSSIEMKENILKATERKIDFKILELEKLKNEVSIILDSYEEKEVAKINRLVKIYENMKAKQAAPIFEKMDLKVLLRVVSRMKEGKSAQILAKLSPERAKTVSEMLLSNKTLKIKKKR